MLEQKCEETRRTVPCAFEIAPDSYQDIGMVEWDHLSDDSQAYLKGRFVDTNSRTFLDVSGKYCEKGAITP